MTAPLFVDSRTKQTISPTQSTFTTAMSDLKALMVTLGPHGFMIVRRCSDGDEDKSLFITSKVNTDVCSDENKVVGLFFEPPPYDQIVSVSGAGDCLASGFISGMLAGLSISECASIGNAAASVSLANSSAVPSTLHKMNTILPPIPFTLVKS